MNDSVRTTFPEGSDIGIRGVWLLPTVTEEPGHVRDGLLRIEGRFLGVGSARRGRHSNHRGEYATRDDRCSVCRWFETRIFRVGGEYVLYHVGRSIVPGERDFTRHERAFSPEEVIERYTYRNRDTDEPFLGRPAALALSQAVSHDDDLRDAYENRAVL